MNLSEFTELCEAMNRSVYVLYLGTAWPKLNFVQLIYKFVFCFLVILMLLLCNNEKNLYYLRLSTSSLIFVPVCTAKVTLFFLCLLASLIPWKLPESLYIYLCREKVSFIVGFVKKYRNCATSQSLCQHWLFMTEVSLAFFSMFLRCLIELSLFSLGSLAQIAFLLTVLYPYSLFTLTPFYS